MTKISFGEDLCSSQKKLSAKKIVFINIATSFDKLSNSCFTIRHERFAEKKKKKISHWISKKVCANSKFAMSAHGKSLAYKIHNTCSLVGNVSLHKGLVSRHMQGIKESNS